MWDLLFDGVLTIALYPTFCIWLICFYSFKMWKMTSLYLCVIHFHYCSALKRLLVYFHDYMWLIVCESKINCPTVCCRCFAESWNGAAAEPLCFCLDPEPNKARLPLLAVQCHCWGSVSAQEWRQCAWDAYMHSVLWLSLASLKMWLNADVALQRHPLYIIAWVHPHY